MSQVVYLLHFSRPYQHAQHYLGWTRYLKERLEHHRNGTGAKLTRAVAAAGIEMKLVRVWENQNGHFERKLHQQKNSARLCPVCNPKRALNNMSAAELEQPIQPPTEQETENYGRNFWE